jgi:catechol 2,3-dioxygenase-like lactoylglutathione lyase family enzyme
MPDELRPAQLNVQVHSLLHTNLNTVDVSAAAAFYAELLELRPGMKTARTAADGRALGVAGAPVTECWFLYDHRGPRTAPAVEVLEWETPATIGAHPAEPNHIGLSALGYAVPSLSRAREQAARHGRPWVQLGNWPVRGSRTATARTTDLDDVLIELTERPAEAPAFSHLRINVTDLDASVAWYEHIGFKAEATKRAAAADAALFSYASMITDGDPSFSIELTQWQDPKGAGLAASPAYRRGLYRIALGVDDVNAAHEQLSLTAAEPLPAPQFVELPGTRLGGVTVLFLRDPDGVVVELVGRSRSHMRR